MVAWMLKSAEGKPYYKTLEDYEANPRRPYQPPAVVALIQAARYLRATPWELLAQPTYWTNVALTLTSIESEVQSILARRNT